MPHARITVDNLGEIVGARRRTLLPVSSTMASSAPSRAHVRRRQSGLHRAPWRRAWLWPCEQRPRRRIERLRARDKIFLWLVSARRKTLPSILSNIVRAASVRTASISRANTINAARRRGVSKRERCCALRMAVSAQSRRSAPDECVARDPARRELAHILQPFDESGEIFLAWRFRPFP